MPQVRWADLREEEDHSAILDPSSAPAISLKISRIREIQGSGVSTPCVSSPEDVTGLELPSLNGDWNSLGFSHRRIIIEEKSTISRAVSFGVRLRRCMRRKIPVPSGVCQAFYIGDTGISEDLLDTFMDEYSAGFFGEAASRVVDDAFYGVGSDIGLEVDALSGANGEEVIADNRETNNFGEAAFGVIDDAYCGVENDFGQVSTPRVSVVRRFLQTIGS